MSDENTNEVVEMPEADAPVLTEGGGLEDLTQAGQPPVVLRLVNGARERYVTREQILEYVGHPLGEMMAAAIKAPGNAKIYVDGVERSRDWMIPEDFNPSTVEVMKPSGSKGSGGIHVHVK